MKPIVLAITGASAQPLAEKALEILLSNNIHVHLIISKGAHEVWSSEMKVRVPVNPKEQEIFWRDRLKLTSGHLECHKWDDNAASIASGSYQTRAMIIIPCTMGTVGRIASGISNNLIERAADVHLKEGRDFIICPRESPLSLIHLNNLVKLKKSGATIIPPMPAWYGKPKTIDDIVEFIVVRLLDFLGEELRTINRWEGN